MCFYNMATYPTITLIHREKSSLPSYLLKLSPLNTATLRTQLSIHKLWGHIQIIVFHLPPKNPSHSHMQNMFASFHLASKASTCCNINSKIQSPYPVSTQKIIQGKVFVMKGNDYTCL